MALADKLKPEVAEQLPLDWSLNLECLEVLLDNSYRNPEDLPLWVAMDLYGYVRAGEFKFKEYMKLFESSSDHDESWLFDV